MGAQTTVGLSLQAFHRSIRQRLMGHVRHSALSTMRPLIALTNLAVLSSVINQTVRFSTAAMSIVTVRSNLGVLLFGCTFVAT